MANDTSSPAPTPDEQFAAAVERLKEGRLAEAEAGLSRVVARDSKHTGALYYLAHIARIGGRLDGAAALLGEVLRLSPDNAKAHHALGATFKAMGRLEDAVESFRRAIRCDRAYGVALNNLGNALQLLGRLDEAEQSYRAALALDGREAASHNNLGVVLRERGELEAAKACFQKALDIDSDNAEALNNMGTVQLAMGNTADAVASFERALAQKPDELGANLNLGLALRQLQRFEEAIETFERVLRLDPDDAKVMDYLGQSLHGLGRLDEAVATFEKAIALAPNEAGLRNDLGNVLVDQGAHDEAVENFERELEIDPEGVDVRNNLGIVLGRLDRLDEAIVNLEGAVAREPEYAEAHNNLGNVLVLSRRLGDAVGAYRRALAIRPDYVKALSNLIFALDMDPEASAADQHAERRRFNELHVRPLNAERPALSNDPDPQRKLRIGYVSADFRRHSAAYLFGPALLHFDRAAFAVTCYSNSLNDDDLTARFKDSVTGWREIYGKSDAEVIDMIQADGIDILVDLSGHSLGNRLLVFARKPAPVQVTAWGHATGTGIETMDYLFGDPVFLPDDARRHISEQVYDLPCALGYLCPEEAPPVAALPALGEGRISFGCFNRLEKISPAALDLWAELLGRMPSALMVLKDKPLSNQGQQDKVRQEFTRRGIAAERLVLLGHTSWSEHMAYYGRLDIALDPFPHNGGTTTMEGLWMGVPAVTLKGATPTGRGTASILAAMDLSDWIAETPEQYLAIAEAKAVDVKGLRILREGMRRRMAASPLGHAPTYVGAVEAAYHEMWRRWCEAQTHSQA